MPTTIIPHKVSARNKRALCRAPHGYTLTPAGRQALAAADGPRYTLTTTGRQALASKLAVRVVRKDGGTK